LSEPKKDRFISTNELELLTIMVNNNGLKDYAKQNDVADALHKSIVEYLKTKEQFGSR
jgi:hypothetical protein